MVIRLNTIIKGIFRIILNMYQQTEIISLKPANKSQNSNYSC